MGFEKGNIFQFKPNKSSDVWKYIDIKGEDECWEWKRSCRGGGYGHFRVNYKYYIVSRLVYIETYGPIPNKLLVCHTCDNRRCCNPNHLYIGTPQNNMDDMISKNRDRKASGIRHGNHKLTEEQVIEIKKLYLSDKYTHKELGIKYNVSRSNIGLIINGKIWSDIN